MARPARTAPRRSAGIAPRSRWQPALCCWPAASRPWRFELLDGATAAGVGPASMPWRPSATGRGGEQRGCLLGGQPVRYYPEAPVVLVALDRSGSMTQLVRSDRIDEQARGRPAALSITMVGQSAMRGSVQLRRVPGVSTRACSRGAPERRSSISVHSAGIRSRRRRELRLRHRIAPTSYRASAISHRRRSRKLAMTSTATQARRRLVVLW